MSVSLSILKGMLGVVAETFTEHLWYSWSYLWFPLIVFAFVRVDFLRVDVVSDVSRVVSHTFFLGVRRYACPCARRKLVSCGVAGRTARGVGWWGASGTPPGCCPLIGAIWPRFPTVPLSRRQFAAFVGFGSGPVIANTGNALREKGLNHYSVLYFFLEGCQWGYA